MKWILLFLPLGLLAQEKTVNWNTQSLLEYFQRDLGDNTRMIDIINSVDGETWVAIPIEQKIKKNEKTTIVDGYPVQYRKSGEVITILDIKTKYKLINFVTKKITTVNSNTDKDLWKRPKDKDIKEKLKKVK